MAIQLTLDYEQLLTLVDQLSEEQRTALLLHLHDRNAEKRPFTVAEKLVAYHTAILSMPVNEEPSVRREDWYGDDGR